MSMRIVIFTGGLLGDWELDLIQPGDVLIGADGGARFLVSRGVKPDIAIGDFDSVTEAELAAIRSYSAQVISCDPVDKNYTDTEMSVRLALDMQPDELLLLGALGSRFDHTLANVHLLALAAEAHVPATIIDNHNKITLAAKEAVIERGIYPNVSLLPLSAEVRGITLTGFQYPLTDAVLTIRKSLGISNMLLTESGTVKTHRGSCY